MQRGSDVHAVNIDKGLSSVDRCRHGDRLHGPLRLGRAQPRPVAASCAGRGGRAEGTRAEPRALRRAWCGIDCADRNLPGTEVRCCDRVSGAESTRRDSRERAVCFSSADCTRRTRSTRRAAVTTAAADETGASTAASATAPVAAAATAAAATTVADAAIAAKATRAVTALTRAADVEAAHKPNGPVTQITGPFFSCASAMSGVTLVRSSRRSHRRSGRIHRLSAPSARPG